MPTARTFIRVGMISVATLFIVSLIPPLAKLLVDNLNKGAAKANGAAAAANGGAGPTF